MTEFAEALDETSEPGGAHSQADEDDPSGRVAPLGTLDDERGGNLVHFTDDAPN